MYVCRLISRAWEIASTRYDDPKLAKKTASKLFSTRDAELSLEYFNCRTSQAPLVISWINFFKMAVFCSNNGQIYRRVCGVPIVSTLANAFSPLYFEVTEAMEVMATEEPCGAACKFGDGLLAIEDYPLIPYIYLRLIPRRDTITPKHNHMIHNYELNKLLSHVALQIL